MHTWLSNEPPRESPTWVGVLGWAVIGWVCYLGIGAWDREAVSEAQALQAHLAALPAQVRAVLAGK